MDIENFSIARSVEEQAASDINGPKPGSFHHTIVNELAAVNSKNPDRAQSVLQKIVADKVYLAKLGLTASTITDKDGKITGIDFTNPALEAAYAQDGLHGGPGSIAHSAASDTFKGVMTNRADAAEAEQLAADFRSPKRGLVEGYVKSHAGLDATRKLAPEARLAAAEHVENIGNSLQVQSAGGALDVRGVPHGEIAAYAVKPRVPKDQYPDGTFLNATPVGDAIPYSAD